MRQIPYVSLRNSKQMARKLKVAVGQRTEMAANVRTDDGLTNGASNIIKLIQLRDDINHLVLFGSSLTVKMFLKRPDRKTEIYISEVLKVRGHQLNLLQHNLRWEKQNQLK